MVIREPAIIGRPMSFPLTVKLSKAAFGVLMTSIAPASLVRIFPELREHVECPPRMTGWHSRGHVLVSAKLPALLHHHLAIDFNVASSERFFSGYLREIVLDDYDAPRVMAAEAYRGHRIEVQNNIVMEPGERSQLNEAAARYRFSQADYMRLRLASQVRYLSCPEGPIEVCHVAGKVYASPFQPGDRVLVNDVLYVVGRPAHRERNRVALHRHPTGDEEVRTIPDLLMQRWRLLR